MKYKIAIFVIAVIAFLSLSNRYAFAAGNSYNSIINSNLNNSIIYAIQDNNGTNNYIIAVRENPNFYFVLNNNSNPVNNITITGYGWSGAGNSYDYYYFERDPLLYPDDISNTGFNSNTVTCYRVVNIRDNSGIQNNTDSDAYFDSLDDYEDFLNPPSEPTWYESLFTDFIDYIGAGLTNGIDGFLDWLREAWITPVGEGEDELALDLITPTPTPSPLPTPTPIPYQTQLVPDGNGGYNIQYIYVNPSGVPTSAPQPPTNQPQPTGSGSNDDDFDYPYYDNPNNKDDPYTLDIPWYLKFSFGGAVTSLDDFQEGMDAIVDNVNDQDENISVVMDSMGLFPSDWLLMIGFIGAIPLVGGLISRLLKG